MKESLEGTIGPRLAFPARFGRKSKLPDGEKPKEKPAGMPKVEKNQEKSNKYEHQTPSPRKKSLRDGEKRRKKKGKRPHAQALRKHRPSRRNNSPLGNRERRTLS